MNAITFDTHKIVKIMLSKGYTPEQADGFIDIAREIDFSKVATKPEIELFKSEMKSDFKELAQQLELKISDAKLDIIKLIVPLILGIYAFLVGIFLTIILR